ncbi:MAG TPA: S-adenosylmethionine decarboxylase [Candidatus Moranbacteria bacterium]|nr:S-adenosylmethionine decarboxylase [Candidatus Moranbacteria bacterium]
MSKDQELVKKYKKENPWGMSTCIDIYDCNPKTIRSASKIKKFVKELCVFIDMKRFGETVVVNFGEDPRVSGFSMTQLIETSLISGHFANNTNAVYLDVFSCKAYPPHKTAEFAKKFFEGKKMEVKVSFRY